jgi:hypothetical protein
MRSFKPFERIKAACKRSCICIVQVGSSVREKRESQAALWIVPRVALVAATFLPFPYGYSMMLRVVVCVTAGVIAINAYVDHRAGFCLSHSRQLLLSSIHSFHSTSVVRFGFLWTSGPQQPLRCIFGL